MVDAKVPLHYRDTCAGILIPLNECRRDTLYLPWKCQDLRHAYEKCQYMECVRADAADLLIGSGSVELMGAMTMRRWKKRVEILKNEQ